MNKNPAIQSFINKYLVLIVCIPMLVGLHWGWAKIQDNPQLVDQEHKKEIPVIMV